MARRTPKASDESGGPAPAPASRSSRELRFVAPLVHRRVGTSFHVVEVPPEAAQAFGGRSYSRLVGTVNGAPVERALIPVGDGHYVIILGADIRRAAKISLGSMVQVVMRPDPRPDTHVDVPEELAQAQALEPGARAKYDAFTPGYRRSLHIYLNQAKRPETRAKRAVELAQKIATGTLDSQLQKNPKTSDTPPDADQASQAFDAGSF